MDEILLKIYGYLAEYGLKVLGAVAILLVGRWLAGVASRLVEKAIVKANIDKTLAKFGKSLTYIVLLIFVAISALHTMGVISKAKPA